MANVYRPVGLGRRAPPTCRQRRESFEPRRLPVAHSTRRRENAQAGHSVSSAFFRKPVGGGGLEEFGDGDTLAADEELGGGMVGFVEGGDAGQGFLATSAFDLDGDKGVAALEHEVHLQIPLAPVGDLDAGAHGGVDEVRANGGFRQSTPGVAIGAPACGFATGLCGHEGGVEHLQFGAGSALADLVSRKLLQTGDHACPFEELEVVSERNGIARIHQLAEHFLVGEDLPGIRAGKLEQAPQQRGLIDTGEQQDVARERGFDQRIVDVLPPAVGIVRQRGGSRIGSEKQEFFQIPAEGLAHLGE